MPELTAVQPPKVAGFVDRGYNHAKKRKQIEEEEKEIARLEALARGEEVEETEESETETQEVTQEEVKAEEEDSNLSREEQSFKKRYGDLRRHMQQKEKEWEEKFNTLETRSKAEGIIPPKSDEDIEQWAKQYPDVAGIVETIAAKKAQEMFQKAESRLSQLDEIQLEATRKTAEAKIREAHPDFDKLRAADEFHDWADEQPKWVQDAIYENADDPASVIRVIDLYKVDKGLTKTAQKQSKKAAASMISKGSKPAIDADDASAQIRESQVAKMSDKEFAANEEAINAAIRSGKFIYDISGKAR